MRSINAIFGRTIIPEIIKSDPLITHCTFPVLWTLISKTIYHYMYFTLDRQINCTLLYSTVLNVKLVLSLTFITNDMKTNNVKAN